VNIIIINDTRREVGHLGCLLVMEVIERYCKQLNWNILQMVSHPRRQEKLYKNLLGRCDLVIVNGEGSMHHDQGIAVDIFRLCILSKGDGVPVCLINSVWQDNVLLDKQAKIFNKMYVRESCSQFELKRIGLESKVVPDLSFLCGIAVDRNGQDEFVFIDSWHNSVSDFLYAKSDEFKVPFFKMGNSIVDRKLSYFGKILNKFIRLGSLNDLSLSSFDMLSKKGICISGRFHGVTLSIAAGVPVVAIGSNTHKIQGLLFDVFGHDWSRMYINPEELDDETLKMKVDYVRANYELLQTKISRYMSEADYRIALMFNELFE